MIKKLIIIYAYLLIFMPMLMILEAYFRIGATLITGVFIIIPIIILLSVKEKFFKNLIIYLTLILLFYFSTKNNGGIAENHSSHIKALILLFVNFDLYDISNVKEIIRNILKKNTKVTEILVMFFVLLNGLYVFLDNGYSNSYSESWGVNAYCGIFSDPHQFAYRGAGVLTLVLYTICAKSKRNIGLFIESVLIIGLILLTGARVPTILAIYLEILIVYETIKKLKINMKGISIKNILFLLTFFFVLFFVIGVLIEPVIKETSFYKKFVNSINSGDFDNGRTRLRELDWKYFSSLNFDKKCFGNGTDQTIKMHEKYLNIAIWSHNDFMQLLVSFGFFVTIYYIIKILSLIIKIDNKFLQLMNYIFIFVLILVAYENGLYIHPRFVVMINVIRLIFDEYSYKLKKVESEK